MDSTLLDIAKMLAFIMSVTGAYLVATKDNKKRRFGFCIWFVSNMIWLTNSISLSDWTQSALWIYYNVTCVQGYANNR